MRTIRIVMLLITLGQIASVAAQTGPDNAKQDSLYIQEVEAHAEPAKVLHAEPLYIDLIRDLGARRGEREWNVGLGLTDNNTYDRYEALVEYEWAPVNRLGLEVELPFSFYYPVSENGTAPSSRLNSLKLAAQYTFLVSERHRTSMAMGYLHEFELVEFDRYGRDQLYRGNVYNPFFVAAKRWGTNFHTLLYTGPLVSQHFSDRAWRTEWAVNSNFHYMISGTRNFIGLELNKVVTGTDFDMTLRPQMRLGIADNLLIGIVAGVPVRRENERFSCFLRLIYEPPHRDGGH